MEQLEEKNQETDDDLKKKLQGALMREKSCWSGPSKINSGKKDLKIEELDVESQLMIADIEALRESDDKIHNKVLNMLEEKEC